MYSKSYNCEEATPVLFLPPFPSTPTPAVYMHPFL